MVQIDTSNDEITVSVGQEMCYQTNVHGSVGKQSKVSSDNKVVLKLKNTKFAYNRPERAKFPGGDSATKTYIFEALQVGKCTVVIQKLFRGKLEKEHIIKINVIDENKID